MVHDEGCEGCEGCEVGCRMRVVWVGMVVRVVLLVMVVRGGRVSLIYVGRWRRGV